MDTVKDYNGRPVCFAAAVQLMDKDLAEFLYMELTLCDPQKFFEEYAKRHEKKYLEEFAPWSGGEW